MEYDENSFIHLQEGVLGFAKLKDYVLIEIPDTDPLKILQSPDDPYVAFSAAEGPQAQF